MIVNMSLSMLISFILFQKNYGRPLYGVQRMIRPHSRILMFTSCVFWAHEQLDGSQNVPPYSRRANQRVNAQPQCFPTNTGFCRSTEEHW